MVQLILADVDSVYTYSILGMNKDGVVVRSIKPCHLVVVCVRMSGVREDKIVRVTCTSKLVCI